MAKATVTVVPKKVYTLELDENEAQFLADVFAFIGGDPDKSRRKYANRIGQALSSVGVEYQCPIPDKNPSHCAIYFQDSKL